jgi:hypothetical protein
MQNLYPFSSAMLSDAVGSSRARASLGPLQPPEARNMRMVPGAASLKQASSSFFAESLNVIITGYPPAKGKTTIPPGPAFLSPHPDSGLGGNWNFRPRDSSSGKGVRPLCQPLSPDETGRAYLNFDAAHHFDAARHKKKKFVNIARKYSCKIHHEMVDFTP